MENRRWLLAREDGAEIEIIHDGFHVRAKPKGDRWSNQSFPSPEEAGEAVEAWLKHLTDEGWAIAAEGDDAELLALWNKIAEHPRKKPGEEAEVGPDGTPVEPERDEDWLKVRLVADALEYSMASALAEQIFITAVDTLQFTNRKLLIDFSPIIDALTECPPATVSRLIIDTLEQTPTKQARFPWGEIGGMLSALPNLQYAYLCGDCGLAMLESDSLISLRVIADPVLPGTLDEIANARLPNLRDLVICMSTSEPVDRDSLRGLLELMKSNGMPSLERLQLLGVENPAALVVKLADTAMMARLKTFQITGADLEDEDESSPLLLSVAGKLGHLKTLGLGVDILSEEGLEALTTKIPGLADDYDLEDPFLPEGCEAWAIEERLG